eukprot:2516327-Pleurochrysis_carterae.AAC.2
MMRRWRSSYASAIGCDASDPSFQRQPCVSVLSNIHIARVDAKRALRCLQSVRTSQLKSRACASHSAISAAAEVAARQEPSLNIYEPR